MDVLLGEMTALDVQLAELGIPLPNSTTVPAASLDDFRTADKSASGR